MGGVLGQPPQGGVDLLPTLKTPTRRCSSVPQIGPNDGRGPSAK
jgi:hypothetical protein